MYLDISWINGALPNLEALSGRIPYIPSGPALSLIWFGQSDLPICMRNVCTTTSRIRKRASAATLFGCMYQASVACMSLATRYTTGEASLADPPTVRSQPRPLSPPIDPYRNRTLWRKRTRDLF